MTTPKPRTPEELAAARAKNEAEIRDVQDKVAAEVASVGCWGFGDIIESQERQAALKVETDKVAAERERKAQS